MNLSHSFIHSLNYRGHLFTVFELSSISFDNPHYNFRIMLSGKASPVRALLNPGDVLYLPAYWHHEVQSLPDPLEALNVAVNFWFKNVTYPIDDHNILGINK